MVEKRYPLDGEPTGIDISEHALRFCHRRGATALALASAVELPFAPSSFDLVTCIDTLQHLTLVDADLRTVATFARLLQPGGVLYLRTDSIVGRPLFSVQNSDVYRRYRVKPLATLALEAGLTTERATYLTALPSIWTTAHEYVGKIRAARSPGSQSTAVAHFAVVSVVTLRARSDS